jgi:hypothetical protein
MRGRLDAPRSVTVRQETGLGSIELDSEAKCEGTVRVPVRVKVPVRGKARVTVRVTVRVGEEIEEITVRNW